MNNHDTTVQYTPYGTLYVERDDLRQVLTIGSTAAGGSVCGALHVYLLTPAGRWGQSQQAWARLVEACDLALRSSLRRATEVARRLETAAIEAQWERHPSRGEDAAA